ncbi:hypothetical protein ASPWEDRAFT_44238 [Aspergillus wentii DTO 134E9]|uniref:T6SS Phospholipase effector Tle1-like catalytic domain-containing protein n=1 Tax=Aspergillus wentii DTO 134E9 TaxID=1073089 RepID=A0A1L9RB84_ASPWE|nr:uncharacterized protein ASPWEDRAFT_44238 [Aspergillus wentii DTO 134E9]OJJ32170.1 hypothetical protein ASPWEDRAFT_44238 [Aspergillus wentii DTO 134E9]
MKQPRRIILCLDGTGNQFQGNESDTNVVKIYRCWIGIPLVNSILPAYVFFLCLSV